MFCHKCGAPNDDNAWKCTRCGEVLHHDGPPAFPASPGREKGIPTHLAFAIAVAIFFIPSPVGLVALYYALRTRAQLATGDFDGAKANSARALVWSWIAALAGLAIASVAFKYMFSQVQRSLGQLYGL